MRFPALVPGRVVTPLSETGKPEGERLSSDGSVGRHAVREAPGAFGDQACGPCRVPDSNGGSWARGPQTPTPSFKVAHLYLSPPGTLRAASL